MMKVMEIFRKHRRNHYSGMGQCFSLIEQQLCTEDLIIHDPKSSIIEVTKGEDFGREIMKELEKFIIFEPLVIIEIILINIDIDVTKPFGFVFKIVLFILIFLLFIAIITLFIRVVYFSDDSKKVDNKVHRSVTYKLAKKNSEKTKKDKEE